jgi:hypothetical protein
MPTPGRKTNHCRSGGRRWSRRRIPIDPIKVVCGRRNTRIKVDRSKQKPKQTKGERKVTSWQQMVVTLAGILVRWSSFSLAPKIHTHARIRCGDEENQMRGRRGEIRTLVEVLEERVRILTSWLGSSCRLGVSVLIESCQYIVHYFSTFFK